MLKGRQIAGVDSDVFTDMTATINTWQEISLTFTPTEAGVVEILIQAIYNTASGNLFVDNMTVTQV